MATRHPKIEVWQAPTPGGAWWIHMRAANGRVQWAGEGYPTKAHALRAVRSIIKAVANADVVVLP